ncbi:MAG: hypothetical protein IPM20_07680 [Gammaproteobacteria bacterium]|nr:hypothetical protein [Gammaproteobacteria bacterium]
MNHRKQTLPDPDATPQGTLTTPELVLVTTLRLWVTAACGPAERNMGIHWYEGLATAGVSEKGSMAFHELMEAIVLATYEPLDFRPMHCHLLGRDERRVLRIIGLLQHNRKNAAASALSDWIPPTACRRAGTHALLLAGELLLAGLTLPLCGEETLLGVDRPDRHSGATAVRASTLIH